MGYHSILMPPALAHTSTSADGLVRLMWTMARLYLPLATWRMLVVCDGAGNSVGLSIGADEALIVVNGLRFLRGLNCTPGSETTSFASCIFLRLIVGLKFSK